MLQGMMNMFSNPAMMTMGGAKLTKIQGHKAQLKENNDRIEISFVYNGKALLSVKGRRASEEEVRALAEALKLEAIN
mgnify:CR=1 FL=1